MAHRLVECAGLLASLSHLSSLGLESALSLLLPLVSHSGDRTTKGKGISMRMDGWSKLPFGGV